MLRGKCKPEKKVYARRMRKNPTEGERVLWTGLRRRQLGYRFTRQNVIRGYIVDFYCPRWRLVVEVDGPYHEGQSKYDARRDAALAKIGILTIRFTNDDVLKVRGVAESVEKIKKVIDERRLCGVVGFDTILFGKRPSA